MKINSPKVLENESNEIKYPIYLIIIYTYIIKNYYMKGKHKLHEKAIMKCGNEACICSSVCNDNE